MNLALKHAIFAILLIYSFATLVAAAPLEDATVASYEDRCAAYLRRIRPLAEQGDAVAQRRLGYIYEMGTCVPKNYTEAMNWYRKAADQGDAYAQHNVGVMYLKRLGVPRDYFEAAKWGLKGYAKTNFGRTIYIGVLVWTALSAAVALAAITRGRDGSLWFLLAWVISPLAAGIILFRQNRHEKAMADFKAA